MALYQIYDKQKRQCGEAQPSKTAAITQAVEIHCKHRDDFKAGWSSYQEEYVKKRWHSMWNYGWRCKKLGDKTNG